jgi:hypothetical protein
MPEVDLPEEEPGALAEEERGEKSVEALPPELDDGVTQYLAALGRYPP